jgi:hypothetical protein
MIYRSCQNLKNSMAITELQFMDPLKNIESDVKCITREQ